MFLYFPCAHLVTVEHDLPVVGDLLHVRPEGGMSAGQAPACELDHAPLWVGLLWAGYS